MNAPNLTREDYLIRYAFLITPYASAIACLYLQGYWRVFKINIFNFVSLTDILKMSVAPFAFILVTSGMLIIVFYFIVSIPNRLPRRIRWFNEPIPPLANLVFNSTLIVISIAILVLVNNPDKWIWSGLINAAVLSRIVAELNVLRHVVSETPLRFVLVFSITVPLFTAFGLGTQMGRYVLYDDKSTRLIPTTIFREHGNEFFMKKHLLEGQDKLKYIGMTGDYVFFLSADNSRTYIVKFTDLHFFEFPR